MAMLVSKSDSKNKTTKALKIDKFKPAYNIAILPRNIGRRGVSNSSIVLLVISGRDRLFFP